MGLLDGKVAIVTGGGNGMGEGIAKCLAANGATVVVNDLGVWNENQINDADRVVNDIIAAGGKAVANLADVSDYNACERLVNGTYEQFGKIDIVALIAGTIIKNPIDEMTEAQFDKVVAVNLKQCYNICHFAAKYMKEQGHGRIVIYASRGAFGNFDAPTQSCCYAASKAGVIGFCSELAIELIPFGDIKVNCVLPAAQSKLFPNERKPGYGGVPGAWPSKPDYTAPMTAYLCTDECDCTGELFYIGGTDVGIYPRDRKVIGFMHKAEEQKWDLEELVKMVPEVFGWHFKTRPEVSSYRL